MTPAHTVPLAVRSWNRRVAFAGAAGGAALLALAVWLSRPAPHTTLDPDLLAVAPFDLLAPAVEALWSEGLAHDLAARLDGAGPLRTAPPSVVFKRWTGPADAASVSTLAAGIGAGLAVYGRLTAAGADSVRLAATLYDVSADRPMEEYEVRAPSARMLELSDSLAIRVIGTLSRDRGLAAVQVKSVGSSNPVAVKAFLTGDRYYRRSHYDSARVFYERALEADSSFAMAYSRLGKTKWNRGDDGWRADFLRAGALNRGLAQRESLVVLWDSLDAAMGAFNADTASWSRMARYRQVSELLARLYPADPEAWYLLGEWRYHYGPYEGVTPTEAREAFTAALRADPGFGESHNHVVLLTLWIDGAEAARTALRESGRHQSGISAESNSLVHDLLRPGLSVTEADARIAGASVEVLEGAVFDLKEWPDSGEWAVRLARAVAGLGGERWRLARTLAYRGRLREARGLIGDWHPFFRAMMLANMAHLGSISPDSADAILGNIGGDDYPSLCWWLARRDTSALQHAIARTDSLARHDTAGASWWAHVNQVARAFSVLALGDTATALTMLTEVRQVPDQSTYQPWMVRYRLLTAQERYEEARELLDHPPFPFDWGIWPERVIAYLDRARVHERLGHRDEAARWYAYVADVWRHADPELQPYVDEARAGLARVTGEPR